MSTKTLPTAIIIVLIAAGAGWSLRDANAMQHANPSLQELPTAGTSSIKATATLNPEQPKAGEPTTITFSFTHPDGSAVSDLMVHHARRVHALLVSRDLSSIGHIHPQDFGNVTDEVVRSGRYTIQYTFPRAGTYLVGVDVMTADEALSKQFLIDVEGAPKMGDVAQKDLRREKCFRGYQEDGNDRYVEPVFIADAELPCPKGYKVTMTPSDETITAGEKVQFQYRIEKDGNAVTGLEPYLDAAIHLAIVPASLDTLLHGHGNPAGTAHHGEMHEGHDQTGMNGESMESKHAHAEHEMHRASAATVESTHAHEPAGTAHMRHGGVPESFGPKLVSEPFSFPRAGLYQVFAQVKHEGKIIFSNFMVEVQERS